MAANDYCMTISKEPKKVEDTYFGAKTIVNEDGEISEVIEEFKCEVDGCEWVGKNKRALTAHTNFTHKNK